MHPGVLGRMAEHDPQGIAPGHVADRQGRVVGPHGAGADQDGVALGAQLMDVHAGPPAR